MHKLIALEPGKTTLAKELEVSAPGTTDLARRLAGEALAQRIIEHVRVYFPGRIITHVSKGYLGDSEIITCILRTNKAKNLFALKQGYCFCYTYNLTYPSCSEGGDCTIQKRGDNFYRVF